MLAYFAMFPAAPKMCPVSFASGLVWAQSLFAPNIESKWCRAISFASSCATWQIRLPPAGLHLSRPFQPASSRYRNRLFHDPSEVAEKAVMTSCTACYTGVVFFLSFGVNPVHILPCPNILPNLAR